MKNKKFIEVPDEAIIRPTSKEITDSPTQSAPTVQQGGVWVKATKETFEDEDWMFKHYRYADDKYKLDTELFKPVNGRLQKNCGGVKTKLEPHEVEVLTEFLPPSNQTLNK